ncbi:MAG: hypothetical protein KC593_21920 [Myxococcales bacterium]|nr:hypothetical protein [Myxococcales bacterium]MCB9628292.1 hypothetical protein [Sandaracinaceae bacterium]
MMGAAGSPASSARRPALSVPLVGVDGACFTALLTSMLLAVGGVAAAPAWAQSPTADAGDADDRQAHDARARELYILGDEFYANGRYEAAEEAFAEAYRLSGRPLLLFNLANAQERSGRWTDAADNLRSYREHAPPAELPALDARIGALERRIADRDAESREEPVVVIQHESADLPQLSAEELEVPRQPVRPERVLLPVAAALTVGTFVLALRVRAARQDARAACVSSAGQRLCLPDAASPLARDRRLSLSTDLMAAAALTSAALGVWTLVRGRRARAVDDPTLQVGVYPRGFRLALEGAF